ncbi:hypothetical protein [Nocardioides zeicaulis]|uniref:Uncharacterized protein n=1 Tax=Nocardioides zeicaulis TaxID=1776857 RepID=A0ABV6DWU2_9ACTN
MAGEFDDPGEASERTLAEIIADLTWEDIVADGVTTTEEIDAALRARGLDPNRYDYLYE